VESVLLKNMSSPKPLSVDAYNDGKGYEALKKALDMKRAELIDTVKASGLRGRGGAGFSTGMKWSFIPADYPGARYLACNADESEPGTFKDRQIIEHDPHMIIEGIAIGSYAIGAKKSYIYIRGEFAYGAQCLNNAIQEAYAKGILGKNIFGKGFDLDLAVVRGGAAYVCGEETALLSSIEGKRGYPKLRPPFPANPGGGLHAEPTIINNVETLACVPHIINRGPAWFKAIGPEKSPGPKIFGVSGHVKKPGVFELPMGTPLKEIIYDHCGGILGDKKLKAVIPGGSSCPVLTAEEAEKVNMDFDSLAAIGSMLGSGGVIVMDETVCMVDALYNLERFYAHESCGQCTPCRQGVPWMKTLLEKIERGRGEEGDIDLLLDVADQIGGNTICPLGDAAVFPVRGFVKKFRAEFEEHIRQKRCPIKK
jgi:NADH-quinone oxidoreductase subunit F